VPVGSVAGVTASGGEAAGTIDAVCGDIVAERVDAVVNAANSRLAQGAGVCGAIFRDAGPRDLRLACEALGGCDPGDAKATPGFALAARWIVHTVGPVWHGGNDGEDEILASCYRRSVFVAAELGARTIAFPAISTGVYGFPPPRAAEIAVRTLRGTLREPGVEGMVSLVRLVAFDATTFDLYRALLG
jgi:O-acetyl-ADP-ribose deacetylase (regulator of RNase III)